MRTIPEIIHPPQLIGLDSVIYKTQMSLAAIKYDNGANDINYFQSGLIFGRAQKDEKEDIPILYWRGKDYFSPFFDNYNAVCFFYETDPRNVLGPNSVFNLNLVVMYRQKLYKHNLNYSIQEGFINAIVQGVLQKDLTNENFIQTQVFTQTDTVFNNYSIQKVNSLFKQDEFSCFRISYKDQEPLTCIKQLIT